MGTSKINLATRFGRETINMHDVFATARDCTSFLRAFAFNENKSIEQKSHSGHKNVWGCSSGVCDWQVAFSKKRPSKRINTKLAFCPPNAWFVSSMNLVHLPSCDSIGECSSALLAELPGFKSALIKGLSSARVRVATAVKEVDNINIDHRPALTYRAISRAKNMLSANVDGGYEKLPPFLKAFERLNPGSRVCCQLDTKGRFFRVFLSFGSLVAAQDNWVPVLECDGTHMKNNDYNGVCLVLVGKDGNWKNIPVAIAYVHKETSENFEWFFANCVVAGIKCEDRAIFSDRGKQRDAQVRLLSRGIRINLKFCALHIYFNVCSRFRQVDPYIDNVNGLVFRLQATTTLVEYDKTLSDIQQQFPATRTRTRNDHTEDQSVAEYLREIHPTSWTKFGNCRLTVEEEKELSTKWNLANAFGSSCPLFGGRTTSAVEGQNNALLLGGVRDDQVFSSLVTFCNLVAETLVEKQTNTKKWLAAKHTVTPRAKEMFNKQVWGAAACTVRKSTVSMYSVDDLTVSAEEENKEQVSGHIPISAELNGSQQRTFIVDLDNGSCMRCADRQHLQLPCRHIIAAVFSQSGNHISTSGVFKFYHHAYTVLAYSNAFEHASVSFPFLPALLPDITIQPPPLYNQSGGSSKRQRRDVATRQKRIPSRGEPKSSTAKKNSQNPTFTIR